MWKRNETKTERLECLHEKDTMSLEEIINATLKQQRDGTDNNQDEGGMTIFRLVNLDVADQDPPNDYPERVYLSVEIKDTYYKDQAAKAVFLRD